MRVLGIEIQSKDVCWVVMDGDKLRGTLQILTKRTLPESAADDISNLLLLKSVMITDIRDSNLNALAVIRADHNSSVLRSKIECMIQVAANDVGVPCHLISIQTVNAAEKRKLASVTGSNLDVAYNGGNTFQPKYLRRAAFCAWSVINA
jgi:hypothetical protein